MRRRGGLTLAKSREQFWDGWPAPRDAVPKEPPAALRVHTNEYLPHTGTGTVVTQVALGLERLGVRVALTTIAGRVYETYEAVPDPVKPLMARHVAPAGPTLFLGSPHADPPKGVKGDNLAWLTMWETDRIGERAVQRMNRAATIITPSTFCLDVFRACGVERVALAPLGVDTDVFHPLKRGADYAPDYARPFVVGTAGRMHHGGARKGLDLVAKAFAAADLPNALLSVKCWPDDPLDVPGDLRVLVDRRPLTRAELADWYRGLDVFVLATHGEGWGLQALEAMACGVPVIVTGWSGVLEFVTPYTGSLIDYRLEPATAPVYVQNGAGNWAVPDAGHLVELLRRAHASPAATESPAKHASGFTWLKTAKSVRDALDAAGLLDPKPRVAKGTPHCAPCVESRQDTRNPIDPDSGATAAGSVIH